MLPSLFSMFDPSGFYFGTGWVLPLILTLVLLTGDQFYAEGGLATSLKTGLTFFSQEVLSLSAKKLYYTGTLSLLFVLVALSNLVSNLPYIYAPTAMLNSSLGVALPLWLMLSMSSWLFTPKRMLAHLVPEGAPFGLIPPMVVIEGVSAIIRPITLSVRLMANIMAGHLILALVSHLLPLMGSAGLLLGGVGGLVFTLELSVAVVQGYVMMILLALYSLEN